MSGVKKLRLMGPRLSCQISTPKINANPTRAAAKNSNNNRELRTINGGPFVKPGAAERERLTVPHAIQQCA